MSSSRHRMLAMCAATLALLAAPLLSQESPSQLPRPDLERVDPAVRAQLSQARQKFDQGQNSSGDPARLAPLAGELGRLYLAYDYLDAAIGAFAVAREGQPREFRWAYLQGFAYERFGQLEAAEGALVAALALRAGEPVVQVRLGDLHLLAGRLEEAATLYQAAFAADATCTTGLFGLGEVARRQGQLELAAERFSKALEQHPGTLLVIYPLAQTLRQLGRVEEARGLLEGVDFKQSSMGRWEACADPWSAAISKIATGTPAHLLRATQAAFAGDTVLELAELRKAVAANPQDAVGHKSLAASLQREGDLEGAERHFSEAVQLDPSDASYRTALAEVLLQTNRVPQAVAHFRQALETDPANVAANLRLGEIMLQNQRFDESRAFNERVLEVDPLNRQARLGRAMVDLHQGKVAEAVQGLGNLLDSLPPENPAERLQLATLLGNLGDLPRAMRHYAAVLDSPVADGLRALAHTRLGQGHFRLGDLPASLAAFRAAVAVDPGLEEAQSGLAQALEQEKKMGQ